MAWWIPAPKCRFLESEHVARCGVGRPVEKTTCYPSSSDCLSCSLMLCTHGDQGWDMGLESCHRAGFSAFPHKCRQNHTRFQITYGFFDPHQITLFTQTSLNLQSLSHSYTLGAPQCSRNLNIMYHTNPSKPSTKNTHIKLFTRRS